jgi:acetoacetyl-CoA synthetase
MAAPSDQLWTPTPESIAHSNIGRFAAWLSQRGVGRFDSYEQLWRWSTEDISGFWAAVWEFFDMQASVPFTQVLDSPAMPGTKWLIDARLNYAEHILRRHGERTAIIGHSQTRRPTSLTWDELADQVGRARAGLQRIGIGKGDRVAAYMPNVPETIVAFLATASLGAIWTSCAPEFGVQAVLDRFGQIDPKVLLVVDERIRNGGACGDKPVAKVDDVHAEPSEHLTGQSFDVENAAQNLPGGHLRL